LVAEEDFRPPGGRRRRAGAERVQVVRTALRVRLREDEEGRGGRVRFGTSETREKDEGGRERGRGSGYVLEAD